MVRPAVQVASLGGAASRRLVLGVSGELDRFPGKAPALRRGGDLEYEPFPESWPRPEWVSARLARQRKWEEARRCDRARRTETEVERRTAVLLRDL
jgi:hypothetical protein